MYSPPPFDSRDAALAARIMRTHPFASLITVDDTGLPFVSHLPLHLQARSAAADEPGASAAPADFRLLGHMARANPQWRQLQARTRALVSFLGPHAYMSSKVYPDLARVPTWNYVAVQATVTASLIDHDDAEAKDAFLKCLIGDHEPAYAAQWRALDAELAHRLLAGIVAFELRVDDWQCKLKLNQQRTESHAALYAVYAAGTPQEQALASWMQALGLVGHTSGQEA